MAKRNFRYQHIRTSARGATPLPEKLMIAELGVNIAKDGEKIFLKNTDDEIVSFITEAQVDAKIEEHSGPTDGKIDVLSGAVDSVSGAVDYVSGIVETNTSSIETLDSNKFGAVFYDKNSKVINFYGKSTTGAVLASIETDDFVKDGMIDSVELIEKEGTTYLVITWNTDSGKQKTELDIGDIFDADNYYTKAETDTLLGGKLDINDFSAYSAATKTVIDSKANDADVYKKSETYTRTEVDTSIESATSGKVDTSTFDAFTANTEGSLETKLNKSDFETYSTATETALNGKQETLVSGTNIKTVVNKTLLGNGNVEINITELSDIDVDSGGTVTLDAGSF